MKGLAFIETLCAKVEFLPIEQIHTKVALNQKLSNLDSSMSPSMFRAWASKRLNIFLCALSLTSMARLFRRAMLLTFAATPMFLLLLLRPLRLLLFFKTGLGLEGHSGTAAVVPSLLIFLLPSSFAHNNNFHLLQGLKNQGSSNLAQMA